MLRHIDASLSVAPEGAKRVRITGDVRVHAVANDARVFRLDAIAFQRLRVEASPPAKWRYDGAQITIEWPKAVRGAVSARVRYVVTPERGVQRAGDAIWTAFHTWRWLPVREDPSVRATLSLRVQAPPGWTTIATGDGARKPGADVVMRVPHPSYTYGFFAGVANALHRPHAQDGSLTVWGANAAQEAVVLARTRAAMSRWRARFGVTNTPAQYTQVFVPGRAAQELAGMAFLSRRYLDTLTRDPDADWLIVHELAHQQWGNRVTCATWGDFWLNEAIVTWWVARDMALRGDTASATREVALWRRRVKRSLARRRDPRVVRPGVRHERAGGSVVYHAGALVVDQLVSWMGADAFERALRGWMERGATRGISLTTGAFLDSLSLSAARRTHAECRLRDASATCAGAP